MAIPFGSSRRSTLGVEWELELVDPATRDLAPAAREVIDEVGGKAKHELFASCVEVNTDVCDTVAEARADLADTVKQVAAAAGRRGLGVLCSGSHPLADWQRQPLTPDPRYADLVERHQLTARRLLIFGVHVHVGVGDPARAVALTNALTRYVPHFLALSAASPYWLGGDTGFASYRTKVFEQLSTAGLPPRLADWPDYERQVAGLLASGAIGSLREVWWDVRPHPTYGTVELRICDGLPTLDEVCAVAALGQCLVDSLDCDSDPLDPWVVRENKWRAARYGLDGHIVVDNAGTIRPVREALAELVDDLGPTARRLGCEDELAIVPRLLESGASYQRQRDVAAASGGDLSSVVDICWSRCGTG